MKECKYCGTQYDGNLKSCPSCGANAVVTTQEKMEEEELYRKEKENQQRSVAEPRNQMKRLIGILAGVIVVIVAAVSIYSYVYNHSPVNGILSRTDMEAAYQQGATYYESKDYASAIAELSKVSAESKYYDDAVAMLNDAISIYCDDALSKAATYANSGDYKTACFIIENALQVVPANSSLTTGLASYQESYRNQLRSSSLESVDGYIAENDYPSAIQALRSALEELNGDVELDALLGKYTSEYRDIIISRADAALEANGYEAAIEIANQGLSVLDGDTALLQAIEVYETYRPVDFSDFNVIGRNAVDYTDSSTDIRGNIYGSSYSIGGNTPGSSSNYIEIYIGSEYNTFTATLAPSTEWKWRDDYPTCTIKVYGDDTILASYTINYKDASLNIEIDVSGIDYLKIRMTDGVMWNNILMADARLHK